MTIMSPSKNTPRTLLTPSMPQYESSQSIMGTRKYKILKFSLGGDGRGQARQALGGLDSSYCKGWFFFKFTYNFENGELKTSQEGF